MNITIRVPATSANLGPGFDSLGLALDLWNETVITLAIEYTVQISGEGMERLSPGENNMIIQSAQKLAVRVGKHLPPFHVDCINRIPLSSGLGSSAAAKLTALLGGLVVSTVDDGKVFAHKINVNGNHTTLGHFETPFYITVVLPNFHIS